MSSSVVQLVDRTGGREWAVAALGAVLTGAAVGHFTTDGHHDPLVAAATVLPAAAVFVYGLWLWASEQHVRGDAVFAWAVGGAGVVLALDLWAMVVGAYGSGAATQHVFVQHTSVGALGAAVAGTYSERTRQQSRAQARLRDALDAAMDGVAVLDDDRRVAYANEAFCEAYGTDCPEDALGTHWTSYVPADATDELTGVFADFEENGRTHWHGTVPARREDGHTYPQELSMTPLSDGGYVWVSRDVTEREQRDQRLRVLNRVLRHNVRNALNVVLGRAEQITERRGTDEDAESITAAAEDLLAVSEKARVVEQVLDEDDAATASLADIVRTEAREMRARHRGATVDVTVNADAAVDARLRLAVRELLANAVEHGATSPRSQPGEAAVEHGATSPRSHTHENAADSVPEGTAPVSQENAAEHTDGPHVSVVVEDGDRPTLRVSNDGPGIPAHERRALAGVEEEPLEHASGVGLWAVYWLAKQCDATVDTPDENTIVLRMSPHGG